MQTLTFEVPNELLPMMRRVLMLHALIAIKSA